MTREIKFRAWYNNNMVDIGQMELFEDNTIYINDGMVGANIMQYTGLQDKNGKEVYEGDIFGQYYLLGDNAGEYSRKGKVMWDIDNACFAVDSVNGGWEMLSDYLRTEIKTEVIGNIYENKELIG